MFSGSATGSFRNWGDKMDEMIRAAANGDREAFEKIVEAYEKYVFSICYRMTGNREDAADLSQEVFLKIWRGLPSFRFGCSFSTWIYRVTNNLCIDFLRSRSRRADTISSDATNEDGDPLLPEAADSAAGPEELAAEADMRAQLYRAMDELDEEYKQALVLRAVSGLNYAEIAEILGIREGTVKSRISRAREKIRKRMGNWGNPTEETSSEETERRGSR